MTSAAASLRRIIREVVDEAVRERTAEKIVAALNGGKNIPAELSRGPGVKKVVDDNFDVLNRITHGGAVKYAASGAYGDIFRYTDGSDYILKLDTDPDATLWAKTVAGPLYSGKGSKYLPHIYDHGELHGTAVVWQIKENFITIPYRHSSIIENIIWIMADDPDDWDTCVRRLKQVFRDKQEKLERAGADLQLDTTLVNFEGSGVAAPRWALDLVAMLRWVVRSDIPYDPHVGNIGLRRRDRTFVFFD